LPSLEWNRDFWGQGYDWSAAGDEWSEPWGNAAAQWYGTLLARLQGILPAGKVMEIAPGRGRWTQFLIPAAGRYLGIDLNASCVAACEQRFAGQTHARFAVNDGVSLDAAEDGTCDLIFSFDSLVHAEADVLAAYVPQILRKLSPTGIAFIHHSNLAGAQIAPGEHDHSRAASMSAGLLAEMVRSGGGQILIQELINWRGAGLIDAISIFGRWNARPGFEPQLLANQDFHRQADHIRDFQARYSALS
jgi:hypothetical protein